MQFLKATETKIELQENQRSDQIIDALVHEVIFPLDAAGAGTHFKANPVANPALNDGPHVAAEHYQLSLAAV